MFDLIYNGILWYVKFLCIKQYFTINLPYSYCNHLPWTNAFPHHCVLAFEMRSQTIHNVVRCRSAHSEVVKEFSLIFSESPIKSIVGAFKCTCGYYRMLPKFSFSPLSASSPSEMKQTQKIETPI